MREILLLVNPVYKRKGHSLPLIFRAFEQAGAQLQAMEAGEDRAAGDKARRAVEEGVDAIVVCGGDGTVFDVLQGLAGSDVPLGIVPFGTGNVLAQNLKIPPAERCSGAAAIAVRASELNLWEPRWSPPPPSA